MIWQSSLELSGDALRSVDPIPILMHIVTELQGLDGYREPHKKNLDTQVVKKAYKEVKGLSIIELL